LPVLPAADSSQSAVLGPPMADGAAVLRLLDVDCLLASLDLSLAVFSLPAGTGS
jgi:hypothetical protein